MKKRIKRYDEGGSAIDETKSDVLKALTSARDAKSKSKMDDMASKSKSGDADQDILDAISRTASGVRPSYDYSEMSAPAAAKAANKKAVPKPKMPESTSSSSAEGMKNYTPRKQIYSQVTQREMAERYVKKRRAAQDEDKGMAKGGVTASRRGDGIAQRGKTRGRMV